MWVLAGGVQTCFDAGLEGREQGGIVERTVAVDGLEEATRARKGVSVHEFVRGLWLSQPETARIVWWHASRTKEINVR